MPEKTWRIVPCVGGGVHQSTFTSTAVTRRFSKRQGKEHLPGKCHQVINAQARECPADPDEDEHHEIALQEKPDDGRQERTAPPAEEKSRRERPGEEKVRVLGKKEDRETHRAVLGDEPRDELGIGFGQVEGPPVDLRVGCDEEQHEPHGLQQHVAERGLRPHDVTQPQRTGEQGDGKHGRAPRGPRSSRSARPNAFLP